MLGDGFTCAKGAGNRRTAALTQRKQRVNDPLTCHQRLGDGTPRLYRPWLPNGPGLSQFEINGFSGGSLDRNNRVLHGIAAVLRHGNHGAGLIGPQHTPVANHRGFIALGIHLTRGEGIAGLYENGHVPLLFRIQRGNMNATPDERAGGFFNAPEGTANSVENIAQQTRPQGNGHGRPLGNHRHAGNEPCGVLIDLDGGFIALHGDNLADEPLRPNADHIHHRKALAALDGDNRAVDALNVVIYFCHSCLLLSRLPGQAQRARQSDRPDRPGPYHSSGRPGAAWSGSLQSGRPG